MTNIHVSLSWGLIAIAVVISLIIVNIYLLTDTIETITIMVNGTPITEAVHVVSATQAEHNLSVKAVNPQGVDILINCYWNTGIPQEGCHDIIYQIGRDDPNVVVTVEGWSSLFVVGMTQPFVIATPTAMPTSTPTSTSTPTVMPTSTPTPTDSSTSTPLPDTPTPEPLPTLTNTPVPSNTPEPVPTFTNTPEPPTETPSATPQPEPPTETATQIPTATSPPELAMPTLLTPENGANLQSIGEFSWQWNGELAEDQYFEIQIWHDKHPDRYGAHDAKYSKDSIGRTDNTYTASIALYDIPAVKGRDAEPNKSAITRQDSSKDYYWTVAIVTVDPYTTLLAAEPRNLQINLPGGGSGGGGDSCPRCLPGS